jgi:Ca2+-binding EF-hand superfamily protein
VSLEEFQANLFDKTRAKIEEKLTAGWTFDAAAWQASVDRHATIRMEKVFKQFDTDADGFLMMEELKRAFRAIGLKKRDGEKLEVDEEMFKSFDTNGDGKVSLEEFEANLKPKTRAKIEEKLNENWVFDAARWEASQMKHMAEDPVSPPMRGA